MQMKKVILIALLGMFLMPSEGYAKSKWTSLFNGQNLDGWFVRGKAVWSVDNGILVGMGGMGHIYTEATASDFEIKGQFRITDLEQKSNSGLYFRANPPENNPDGYPRGYEAQICHNQDAHTGWLWKPGTPTGKATRLLTKDGEWFDYRIRAKGPNITFWINGKKVMSHSDTEYTQGHFAIQGHNPGMKIEARQIYFREL